MATEESPNTNKSNKVLYAVTVGSVGGRPFVKYFTTHEASQYAYKDLLQKLRHGEDLAIRDFYSADGVGTIAEVVIPHNKVDYVGFDEFDEQKIAAMKQSLPNIDK